MKTFLGWYALPLLVCTSGCTERSDPGDGTDPGGEVIPDTFTDPGKKVALGLSADQAARKTELDAALAEVADLDAAAFAARSEVAFEELGYDPLEAMGLDLIEQSYIGLSDAERSKLAEQGFVISTETEFPTFAYGYGSIYADDLPLFVSADSIMYAVHRSYDEILKTLETSSLTPALLTFLEEARSELSDLDATAQTKKDLDIFLTVASALLSERDVVAQDPSLQDTVIELVEGCEAASGAKSVELFGATRRVDFSQCKPRGHYTDSEELERYFRAMMWLGRIDLRLIETQEDGSQVFRRRQLEAVLALRRLMTEEALDSYRAIDAVVTAFIGEHDYMTLPQVDELRAQLGLSADDDISGFSDEQLAQAIVDGGFGTQRISSHYVVNGLGSGTLPLSSSFALLGQRYVLDSHVFSNVVYDRVASGSLHRMMPDPLDVAYSALQNDQAGMLLKEELDEFDYAADLASMRVIADTEEESFWQKNLYNRWLGALRTLSPATARVEAEATPLPQIARTEPWGRRLLNTQLASWAELRHDTILYVKQSYTSGAVCEFPDAYVEPYPEFFAAIAGYADHATATLNDLPIEVPANVLDHFTRLSDAARTLEEMAERQRTGMPHSDEHMAFINETVTIDELCGGAFASGWYPELFYGSSTDAEPTIADVHTQPTDAGGAEVGRVLHVGTGNARFMVVTVETCSGPRAYAGLASSYYEVITEDFERFTDPEWEERLYGQDAPEEVDWIVPLLSAPIR